MGERLGALLYVDEWEKVEGAPWPLGATWVESCRGFNFALFPRHATGVTLLLYTENDPANAVCRYTLDPILNKTGLIWHCMLTEEKLCGATLYAYRVEGPHNPSGGQRWRSGQSWQFDAATVWK
jgi:glycogen operon protein